MTAATPVIDTHKPGQKRLGPKGLIVLIALLSAFVPLSTDLYLPALPTMGQHFNSDVTQINLTLTVFFVFYAFGTLVWGPLSDRYGRKPVLLAGLSIYVAASALSAMAWTVPSLIAFRALQAIGGSSAGAVATAIVKDVYSGQRRMSVLAIVQSMVLISPAVAPILGAFLLQVTSWRGVFWVLAVIGVIAVGGTLLFEETITERSTGRVLQSLLRLGKVLQNRSLTPLLVIFSIANLSGAAYIASSTFIYQDGFHLSEQAYSLYFSLNALGMISGPMIYLRLYRRFNTETILRGCYITILLAGVLVFFFGNTSPWIFALCILPSSIAGSCSRAPSTNLMLEQQQGDTGSVSSVIGCTGLLMGSLGMTLISLPWDNMIVALGTMILITSTTTLVFFPLAMKNARRPEEPGLQLVESPEQG